MIFFITGMPGAGKRRLGQQLAGVFNLEYIDLTANFGGLDEASENYRELERNVISRLAANSNSIVVTGSYAPVDERNRRAFKQGKVIFLYMDVDQLWENMTIRDREEYGLYNIALAHGMYEELGDIYLKTADFMCRNDNYSQSAYHAAKQFIETSGLV